MLQCEVQGAYPEPKVEWLDGDNNTVPTKVPVVTRSKKLYNITLQANVTKFAIYRCVSTQKHYGHQIYSETHMYLYGEWYFICVLFV